MRLKASECKGFNPSAAATVSAASFAVPLPLSLRVPPYLCLLEVPPGGEAHLAPRLPEGDRQEAAGARVLPVHRCTHSHTGVQYEY